MTKPSQVNQPSLRKMSDPAWQIQTLADSAKQLAARGEFKEAEKIYRTIIESAPYHLRALYFLAARAMERGELNECEALLERGLRAAPDRPILHQNLALVHKARGDLAKALAALDKATTIKPDFRTGFLHKAEILEQLGRHDEVIGAYWQAFGAFPKMEQLTNDAFAPPEYRAMVQHGAESLRAAQASLIEEKFAPLRDKYGEEALSNVLKAAEIFTGARGVKHAHALQRPSYLYLPGIEPRAFFERADFPWLAQLEAAFPAIRAELEAALASGEGLTPYVQIDAENPMEWRELNRSKKWSSMHLLKGGKWNEENRARCPETARVLESLPLPYIGEHAPEALFSILQPGTHIPPHHGLGNYKLVAHLPLIVPPDCNIRVGNETRGWTEGECLVFDDSFQHEAWNRSGELRAVLIIDVWNPLLTQAEQDGIRALVEAIKAFNDLYIKAGG